MKKYATAEDIRHAAQGNWPAVLEAAGVPRELLNKHHQPCPCCGGTDRFRFTDHKGSGVWICNQCTPDGGSPFDLLSAVFGYSFNEAKDVLAGVLGLQHGETERREAKPLPAPAEKKDEEREKWQPIVPVPEYAEKSMNFAHGYRKPEDLLFKSVFRDGGGRVLGGVARFRKSDGSKLDMPYTFCENVETGVQKWCWRGWDNPRPLYGLDALAAAPDAPVLVVEGEKCKNAADAKQMPFAVVTWHGGCNNWDKADWSPIQGRRVILWPDCDSEREKLTKAEREAGVSPESKPYKPREEQGGYKAMAGIAERLAAQGCDVQMVNIPRPGVWPHGYDIADAFADGGRIIDPAAALSWQSGPDWLVDYRPSEKSSETSPAPALNGVPADGLPPAEAENGSGTAANGGQGEDAPDEKLRELLADFALIEGKVKAFEIKKAVEWSKNGMIAKFGKEAVGKWFESDRKKTFTQSEVNVAKKKQQVFEAENNPGAKDFLERYVYLDGTATAWDTVEKKIVDRATMNTAMGDMFKVWVNSPARRVISFRNLVFEPGMELGDNYINLFEGIPMAGKECFPVPLDKMPRDLYKIAELYPDVYPILKLVGHLCNGDMVAIEYTLNWLAYPLQHIGAKMASALVFHGDTHGAGKTLLFENIIKPIYGDYAATLGQTDLESQYTGNRSQKLFVLFEEIFNNKQKYDHSGAMKHMITGKTMRVEKKFIDSYEEANHINCVFLSNEVQPFKIEENDRRYFVIWPDKKTPDDLVADVNECLGNGGLEKFYSFLLSLPLVTAYYREFGDPDHPEGKVMRVAEPARFDAYTKPPMTAAKENVIAIGRASWQTFYSEWKNGEIPDIPYGCCLPDDLFAVFKVWARRSGEHEYPKAKFKRYIASKMYLQKKWYRWPESNKPDEKRQAALFYPKDMVVPHGTAEMDHIGRQVGKFRAVMGVYLGVAE